MAKVNGVVLQVVDSLLMIQLTPILTAYDPSDLPADGSQFAVCNNRKDCIPPSCHPLQVGEF